VRILFVARHFTYFRNFDSAVRLLGSRGHVIHLAVETEEILGGRKAVEALARELPTVTFGTVPDRRDDAWADVARRVRFGLDYLRYLDPFYDTAPLRRVRARERTPRALIAAAEPPLLRGAAWRRWFGRVLQHVDQALPVPPVVTEFLQQQRPDVLVITPLVDLGSQQVDILRAARQLGIPTVLAVWSWDHLSSKAYLREYPERILVWNPTQRDEAVRVHGAPADRVVVTGAQCFDHWFARRPSRGLDEFCLQLGLPADRPLILYVCTGLIMGSPPEPPFVREWLTRLRASGDPRVATASVLIRPYPSNHAAWQGVDLSDLGPVAVWGGNPVDDQSRADYFDSLYHSAAVVGLNTTAFIEAGIVGRPVLAILPPQFHDNQEGTVHFRYLLEIGGGQLRTSRDLDTHVAQLSAALALESGGAHPHRAFLESFVRPRGLAADATPVFADAIEAAGACRIDPADVGDLERAASSWRRAALAWVAAHREDPRLERWLYSPRELESRERVRAAAAEKTARSAARIQADQEARHARAEQRARSVAEKQARREASLARKQALRAAKIEARRQKRPAAGGWRSRARTLGRRIVGASDRRVKAPQE
jgi:hypothetical protein